MRSPPPEDSEQKDRRDRRRQVGCDRVDGFEDARIPPALRRPEHRQDHHRRGTEARDSDLARSLRPGRRRPAMSTATSVPEPFSAAETALISAASTAAEIRPLSPAGISWLINTGSVWLLAVSICSWNSEEHTSEL